MVLYSSAEEKIKPENKPDFDSDRVARLERIRSITAKYAKLARSRGWDGEMPTREERELWALEYDQKRGWLDEEDEIRLKQLGVKLSMANFKEEMMKRLKEMSKEARQDVQCNLETRQKIADDMLRKKKLL